MTCHYDKQSAAEEQREHLQPQVGLGKDYTQGQKDFTHELSTPPDKHGARLRVVSLV